MIPSGSLHIEPSLASPSRPLSGHYPRYSIGLSSTPNLGVLTFTQFNSLHTIFYTPMNTHSQSAKAPRLQNDYTAERASARKAEGVGRDYMSSRQKAACATAGLACAFGGIWSIDAHVAALSGTPYTTLWMRIISLCVYLAACAIAIREPSIFDGNGETARKRAARLIACSTACLFISLAGSLGFIYGAKGALALACGFAMKLFGAPLTIALVCCYSRIKKADSTKASLIGISGAFVAQSILSSINVQQLWHPLIGICAGFALCAVAIICIAALLCTEAPEAAHAPSSTQVAKNQPSESRNQLPFRNVFTGPFLAILVSTSFMLGFCARGYKPTTL